MVERKGQRPMPRRNRRRATSDELDDAELLDDSPPERKELDLPATGFLPDDRSPRRSRRR
jgi:hypothetical protein